MGNKPLTKNGYEVDDLQPSFYGGWGGSIKGTTVKWCYDFTTCEFDVWNEVDRRELIKGEMDIVYLPPDFDYVPRFHTKAQMIAALKKRGLSHLVQNKAVQLNLFSF